MKCGQSGMHVTMLRLSFAYAIFTAPLLPAHLVDNTSDNNPWMTPFKVRFVNTFFDTMYHSESLMCHVFLFSQWCSTRGTAGCTQSTSSSTLSLQVNSEKCIAFSLKMSLLELQLCGQTTIFQEDLIHQLLRLNYLPIDREGAIQEMNNNFHKLLPMQNNRRHHHHCKLNSGLMRSCIGFYISYCI